MTNERQSPNKGLESRVKQLEAAIDKVLESDKWHDRIQISGQSKTKLFPSSAK